MAAKNHQNDALLIVEDITQAWADLPEGQFLTQEVHALIQGDRSSTGSQAIRATRFDPVTDPIRREIQYNLEQWAENLARGARARNTVDALKRDLRLFCDWCRNTAHVPLPASQDTIKAFLQAFAQSRKVSTLKRYLASVATLHSAAGLANPTIGELVKSEVDLIARNQAEADDEAAEKGLPVKYAKRQAAGLREEDLMKADALFNDTLRGLRDRAIVWLAFDTLARSSEIASMQVADLSRASQGQMTVLIRRSKSDQYGKGNYRYISSWTAERIDAWLRAADITEGHLFRGLEYRFDGSEKKQKGIKAKRVEKIASAASRKVIYRAIKNCAAKLYAAGLIQFDMTAYSAHSTRVGAAQDMLEENVSMLGVQQAGDWKTDVMPKQYAGQIDPLKGGAAQLARKRGRAKEAK